MKKLEKAVTLANNEKNNKFFEIKQEEGFYTKDAMDNKHGFYFLRVGSEDPQDQNLQVNLNVKGTQYQTSDGSKVEVTPDSQGNFHMLTQCALNPS